MSRQLANEAVFHRNRYRKFEESLLTKKKEAILWRQLLFVKEQKALFYNDLIGKFLIANIDRVKINTTVEF